MNRDELQVVAQTIIDSFPAPVMDALADVDMVFCDTVADACLEMRKELKKEFDANDLPPDCKGVFIGNPIEVEDGDDTDTEEDEMVLVAEGFIVLIAANIKDSAEAALVLLHEIGHALDMDEDEVKQLGLGVGPAEAATVPTVDAPPKEPENAQPASD